MMGVLDRGWALIENDCVRSSGHTLLSFPRCRLFSLRPRQGSLSVSRGHDYRIESRKHQLQYTYKPILTFRDRALDNRTSSDFRKNSPTFDINMFCVFACFLQLILSEWLWLPSPVHRYRRQAHRVPVPRSFI